MERSASATIRLLDFGEQFSLLASMQSNGKNEMSAACPGISNRCFILNSPAPVESTNLFLSPILPAAPVRLAFLFQFASELASRTPCLAWPWTR
jgi:molybdopterin biosynthesis enzyme MoaB